MKERKASHNMFYKHINHDWGIEFGPIRFMRFQFGQPKVTQISLGPLWITKHGSKLTINYGHNWMLFHGEFLIDRRKSSVY